MKSLYVGGLVKKNESVWLRFWEAESSYDIIQALMMAQMVNRRNRESHFDRKLEEYFDNSSHLGDPKWRD